MTTKVYAAMKAEGRDAAVKKLVAACRRHGDKRSAAKALGMAERTLHRLVVVLGCADDVDAALEAAGKRKRAGRPRGPMDRNQGALDGAE